MGRESSERGVKKLAPGMVVPLTRHRYGVGLSWDRVKAKVDVDLQAVLVNRDGTIVDAVYYNNHQCMNRAVMHTGDECTGDGDGDDEAIWVNIPRLPAEVRLIIFVVAAYSGGHLKDIDNAGLRILEDAHWNVFAKMPMERSLGDVDVVLVFKRAADDCWSCYPVDEAAETGRHFMDIVDTTLGDVIRRHIPRAPKEQIIAFPMSKGSVVELANTQQFNGLTVVVSWDLRKVKGVDRDGVDLDLSAVCFGADGRDIGAVYFENTSEYGLRHNGDEITGGDSTDDERITVRCQIGKFVEAYKNKA